MVIDISKDHIAFMFVIKQFMKNPQQQGTTVLITSHKTQIITAESIAPISIK